MENWEFICLKTSRAISWPVHYSMTISSDTDENLAETNHHADDDILKIIHRM